VLATESTITVAEPVPSEPVGGISFAPLRVVTYVIGIAWAVGTGSIRAAIRINASEIYLISALPSSV
jgi:hypothetical protein